MNFAPLLWPPPPPHLQLFNTSAAAAAAAAAGAAASDSKEATLPVGSLTMAFSSVSYMKLRSGT